MFAGILKILSWGDQFGYYLGGTKYNHKCHCKKKAEENLAHRRGKHYLTTKAENGVIPPEAKLASSHQQLENQVTLEAFGKSTALLTL